MIPQDFEDWKDCIERRCRIRLTAAFARERLEVYNNLSHSETRQFIKLYGEEHHRRVVSWFTRIATERVL
ncbi:hypothetical protein SAMN05421747_10710 [Parapedobacter composti]|uniref:Uncharacterized protein n=1 Tax=Parapedobacter composti TaxID=623281 RepID=A0A1I1HNK2_9SPHI|nr:hypothetical protein [Parapedobacter composti]SFC25132.1 hypothetical protein SAMN05421747_10710 [Parapedobacter composti]